MFDYKSALAIDYEQQQGQRIEETTSSLSTTSPPSTSTPPPSTTTVPQVTATCYLDFGVCSNGLKKDRRLGDASILCEEPDGIGRVVIGLYGNAAPTTVKNFIRLCESQALTNTVVNRIVPGEFIVMGQQGPRRMGYVEPPTAGLAVTNPDILNPTSFRLKHIYPGTVSLNLSQNPDEEYIRVRKGYKEVAFLITTGPGPVPSLDEENIVFGRVIGACFYFVCEFRYMYD